MNQLAADLGVSSQVAAAQAKLQGTAGAQAKAQLQQRLDLTVPATSGRLVIMRSNQLKTAQDVAGAVNSLAIVLPALAILLFALAIWLARGRRRQALRTAGWCFVVVGVLLLLVRRIGGNEIVDSLVKVPSNEAAVHQAWMIATSLLFAIAVALIIYGVVFALAAWLGGPTRPALFLRKLAAPELRESPWVAYVAAGGLLLALVIWGPTPAFRQLAWILLFAALLALGVTVLRRQTARRVPRHPARRRHARAARAPVGGAGAHSATGARAAAGGPRPGAQPGRRRPRATGGPPRLRAAVRLGVRRRQDASDERLLDGRLLRLGDPGGVVAGDRRAHRAALPHRFAHDRADHGLRCRRADQCALLRPRRRGGRQGGRWRMGGRRSLCRLSGLLRRRPVDDRLGGGGRKKPQGQEGGSSLSIVLGTVLDGSACFLRNAIANEGSDGCRRSESRSRRLGHETPVVS